MYTRGQVIEFIEKAFGEGKPSNGGLNYSVTCPNKACASRQKHKKKFVIHTQSFVAHCWVCGIKVKNLYYALKKYQPELTQEFKEVFLEGRELEYEHIDEVDEKKFRLPEGFVLLTDVQSEKGYDIRSAFGYLRSRGLSQRDFWYHKLGIVRQESDFKHRIILPSFDSEGNLNFFTGRSYNKFAKGTKYLNCDIEKTSIIFNELNIDWTEEVTIVEGPFDLIKCNDNATCMLGSDLDTNHFLFQKIFENETPVLLAFDNDAIKKMYKTASLFSQYGIQVRIFELPQGIHDVGEMSREQFISLMPKAQVFDKENYLKYRIALL